jgi:hypothetical protein
MVLMTKYSKFCSRKYHFFKSQFVYSYASIKHVKATGEATLKREHSGLRVRIKPTKSIRIRVHNTGEEYWNRWITFSTLPDRRFPSAAHPEDLFSWARLNHGYQS